MNGVKFATELPIGTVAFALTLLCGKADADQAYLRGVTEELAQYDHDTIFARAYEIAVGNYRQIFGRDATYNEFMADFDGRDALFFSLPGDTPVLGAMCSGQSMSPDPSVSPTNNPDQKLLILTAMGIARPESDGETLH